MRVDSLSSAIRTDDWLESRCRLVEAAARELANAVGEVNERTSQAQSGDLGRRRRITEAQLRSAEAACQSLHSVLTEVQNALFDCESELRSLRERDVDPAELLVDGERLIRQYRFLRRRARVIDGLLAYLPGVSTLASTCLDHLRRLDSGDEVTVLLRIPDCGFALAALEELREEEPPRKSARPIAQPGTGAAPAA